MGKVTEMTADTAVTKDDLVMTINAPGTTPGSRKVTVEDFFKAMSDLTALGALPASGDKLAIYDISGSAVRSTTIGDIQTQTDQMILALQVFS